VFWKILLEACFAALAFFLASGFWATAKSPAHLRRVLLDPSELERVYRFFDPEKLHREALQIEPVMGSYAANINMWNRSHQTSLVRTRNLMGLGAAVLLFLSWLLGPSYLAASGALFVLPVIFELPDSAKNNNATHIHTVMLNVIKWSESDSSGCRDYCRNSSPTLEYLFETVRIGR